MLGILLIYFIGKNFHSLAGEHGKNQWAFAILGVATYYACTFSFGILLVFTLAFYNLEALDEMNDIVLGLMAVPVGLLGCVGLYYILKAVWERKKNMAKEQIEAFNS